MKRSFGRDFTYKFTPDEDGELIESIPAHTAKALVYSSQPSRSQVVAETGAAAPVIEKDWVANATSIEFDVPAISDPDPESSARELAYYIAIKFKTKTGGDDQIVISTLPMVRVSGTGSALDVDVADIEAQWKPITKVKSPADIKSQIAIQKELLRAELEGKGYDWAALFRPSQLNLAVVFATLGALLVQESEGDGDKWDKLAKHFDGQAEGYLKVIRIEYDQSKVKGTNLGAVTPRGFSVIAR